jgi:hypothetical protein
MRDIRETTQTILLLTLSALAAVGMGIYGRGIW